MGNTLSTKTENAPTATSQEDSAKLYIWGQDIVQDQRKVLDESQDNNIFMNTIDYIACQYILTMDFNTMKKLYDKEYCDKLVILTGDILNRYYSELEIRQMRDRIEHGELVIYAQKNDIDRIPNKITDCYQIAKFYVKIGHLFAAILMTIHPKYEYVDPITGEKMTKTLQQKNEIPANIEVKQYSNGLCHEKMNILLGNLNGDYCSTKRENLAEEPGIPELINLYYDSEYDHTTGEFRGMTEKTQLRFKHDLEEFYRVFTNNNKMPPEITKFSDIKLTDYRSLFCNSTFENSLLKMEQTELSLPEVEHPSLDQPFSKLGIRQMGGRQKNSSLIKDYATNLKSMMRNVNFYQKKLLQIIDDIFVYVDNAVRIEPKLTEKLLYKYIEETRNIIVELYLNCEENFLKGVKIYEAIVENIIFQTTQNQIETLELIMVNIHSPEKTATPISQILLPTPTPDIQNTIKFFNYSV